MPERIKPSSGQFTDIDSWVYLNHILTNPQCYFDLTGEGKEIPELERKVAIADARAEIARVIAEKDDE